MTVHALPLIERKRDGGSLDAMEIQGLISAYVAGDVPDYQMAAFLMAVTIRGMDFDETRALTEAMLRSGHSVDISARRPLVDKHSTGGVGDKTSLAAVPLLATLGFAVPKLSGRGLGHTGGTLDKLESIPGLRTSLDKSEFATLVSRYGLAVAAQSDDIVPADRLLYALRDVTGTVQSLPLIASSIMSKKLAVSSRLVLLDVKVGDGAFFPDEASAEAFAALAVRLGAAFGRDTRALLTRMDAPLGLAVGNALEVREAVDCLKGGGPEDLREVVTALAAEALHAVVGEDRRAARARAAAVLGSGEAYDVFRRWIASQGGDLAFLDDPGRWPRPACTGSLTAWRGGTVSAIKARGVGEAARLAGAGRLRKGESVDAASGVEIVAPLAAPVQQGDELCRVHAASGQQLEAALERLASVWEIGDEAPRRMPAVLCAYTSDGRREEIA